MGRDGKMTRSPRDRYGLHRHGREPRPGETPGPGRAVLATGRGNVSSVVPAERVGGKGVGDICLRHIDSPYE